MTSQMWWLRQPVTTTRYWKKRSAWFMKKASNRRKQTQRGRFSTSDSERQQVVIHSDSLVLVAEKSCSVSMYVRYKIINPFNIDADLHSITHLTSHHCIKSLIAINPSLPHILLPRSFYYWSASQIYRSLPARTQQYWHGLTQYSVTQYQH